MDYIFNPKIEKLPRKEIRKIQLKHLKKTVNIVYDNVPFYKKKFKDLKITPDDIKHSKIFVSSHLQQKMT